MQDNKLTRFSAPTNEERAVNQYELNTLLIQNKVQEKLVSFGEKMVQRSLKKGKSTYEYKVGDQVLIVRDLNNTRKSLSKKPKFSSHFFKTPARIMEIRTNQTYVLEMVDGSDYLTTATPLQPVCSRWQRKPAIHHQDKELQQEIFFLLCISELRIKIPTQTTA